METKHSPLPWHTGGKLGAIVYDADGKPVANAVTFNGVESERMTANAARIVRAVNSRDDLLAACKEAERIIRWAAQEAEGRVKAEIVGGWLHHANNLRKTIARAERQDGDA